MNVNRRSWCSSIIFFCMLVLSEITFDLSDYPGYLYLESSFVFAHIHILKEGEGQSMWRTGSVSSALLTPREPNPESISVTWRYAHTCFSLSPSFSLPLWRNTHSPHWQPHKTLCHRTHKAPLLRLRTTPFRPSPASGFIQLIFIELGFWTKPLCMLHNNNTATYSHAYPAFTQIMT